MTAAFKRTETDLAMQAMWAAKMSTASIAAVLGGRWSEARVYNRLQAMREEERAATVAAPRAAEPKPTRLSQREVRVVRMVLRGMAVLVASLRLLGARDAEGGLVVPKPASVGRSDASAEGRGQTEGGAWLRRFKPVSADILRWSRGFIAARWDLDEVSELFGVHPDALDEALTGGAA